MVSASARSSAGGSRCFLIPLVLLRFVAVYVRKLGRSINGSLSR